MAQGDTNLQTGQQPIPAQQPEAPAQQTPDQMRLAKKQEKLDAYNAKSQAKVDAKTNAPAKTNEQGQVLGYANKEPYVIENATPGMTQGQADAEAMKLLQARQEKFSGNVEASRAQTQADAQAKAQAKAQKQEVRQANKQQLKAAWDRDVGFNPLKQLGQDLMGQGRNGTEARKASAKINSVHQQNVADARQLPGLTQVPGMFKDYNMQKQEWQNTESPYQKQLRAEKAAAEKKARERSNRSNSARRGTHARNRRTSDARVKDISTALINNRGPGGK